MKSFWELDLIEIESSFLPFGKTILDLPAIIDDRVPCEDYAYVSRSVTAHNDSIIELS